MLQLYLHQLIRKNIQQNLKFSYSNYIKNTYHKETNEYEDFGIDMRTLPRKSFRLIFVLLLL